jgi:hypothetical protein
MGGVDVSDQKRECYGVGRSLKNGGNLYYICPKCVSCELFHLIQGGAETMREFKFSAMPTSV